MFNELVECCGISLYNSKESLCCKGCFYEYKYLSIIYNIFLKGILKFFLECFFSIKE